MFVAINLVPHGTMMARADTIGFSDDDVTEINENRASNERVAKINEALQLAAHVLYHSPVTGRPC